MYSTWYNTLSLGYISYLFVWWQHFHTQRGNVAHVHGTRIKGQGSRVKGQATNDKRLVVYDLSMLRFIEKRFSQFSKLAICLIRCTTQLHHRESCASAWHLLLERPLPLPSQSLFAKRKLNLADLILSPWFSHRDMGTSSMIFYRCEFFSFQVQKKHIAKTLLHWWLICSR